MSAETARPATDPARRSLSGRPAVFIDRDGTLIVEKSYLADPDGVQLVPGAARALRRLEEAGFVVVVVTNQSGIARGLYTLEDYHAVAARLEKELAARDAAPHATYFCPHHPESTGPCACRKPGTGMHRSAGERFGVDYRASYFIGDKLSDVLPAEELGGQGILVRTGYGDEWTSEIPEGCWVADDLPTAVERILRRAGGSDGGSGADDAQVR